MNRILLGIAASLVAIGAAMAHSKSEKTVPADGATVAGVERIEIAFDAPMRVTSIKLLRDEREIAVERETGLEPVKAFLASPADALQPGAYRVEWRGLSDDGHPMQGSFGFTVAK